MERRAFPRLKSRINVRLLVNSSIDGQGLVLNFSASGAGIESDIDVAPGDRIVLHLEGGSRFEGVVARLFNGGFGVEFGMHESKRQRLVNALETIGEDAEEMTALPLKQRVANRIGGFRGKTLCRTAAGDIECRLVDMSLSGAAIETDKPLNVGDAVMLGQTRGRVVRRDGDVYGVQFDPIDETGGADGRDVEGAGPNPLRKGAVGGGS